MTDPRPCGTRTDHVPHPWDYGRLWCRGAGKYAEDQRPAPVGVDGPDCTARYVGVTGVVWVCIAKQHPTGPGGYMGTGHHAVAVQPVHD